MDPDCPLNLSEALRGAAGRPEILRQIVHVFLRDLPHRMSGLEAALASGDANAVEDISHALKGAVGTLRAAAAQQLAERLERLGREDQLHEARQTFDALRVETGRLAEFLREPDWHGGLADPGVSGPGSPPC